MIIKGTRSDHIMIVRLGPIATIGETVQTVFVIVEHAMQMIELDNMHARVHARTQHDVATRVQLLLPHASV